MFADTFGVSSRTIGDWISTSVRDNSPTTTITPEAVLSDTIQRLLQKQFLLKPNLLKYLTIKYHKNIKNSFNHLQQLNLIIVVQNIEIESLWNFAKSV